MDKTLIIILGPTGIGKTNTAVRIARQLNTEIISADSRQIFRELHIGTAVPSPEELGMVKHHFIQTHSIQEYYNASRFESDILALLDELFRQKDYVVMTGGSMLYIDAVCKGIDELPDVDPELRESLIQIWKNEGLENLRLRLKKLDPVYYSHADLKNPKRILHALEICLMTGKPYSSFRLNETKKRPFKILKIGLNCDREILYGRINNRVDKMIEKGLVEEAKKVYQLKHLNSLNTVGYKEIFAALDGKVNLEEAIVQIKNNTRKYARKQLTWFRRDKSIKWFEPEQDDQILHFIKSEIKNG
ncbi:MAG: tRNA (adenosine(37)-N6)-dimethylallyltransferase MiaA [Prolixibacteraceae bacterium]|nr:tRNA (adenosine(37)-N6)-dimethylallyltransferase MiaA [Prolixibacteraceae bacterium]